MPYSGKAHVREDSWPNSHVCWIATFGTGRGMLRSRCLSVDWRDIAPKLSNPLGAGGPVPASSRVFTRPRHEVARIDSHFAQPTGAVAIRQNSQVSGTPLPKHASAPSCRV